MGCDCEEGTTFQHRCRDYEEARIHREKKDLMSLQLYEIIIHNTIPTRFRLGFSIFKDYGEFNIFLFDGLQHIL